MFAINVFIWSLVQQDLLTFFDDIFLGGR